VITDCASLSDKGTAGKKFVVKSCSTFVVEPNWKSEVVAADC